MADNITLIKHYGAHLKKDQNGQAVGIAFNLEDVLKSTDLCAACSFALDPGYLELSHVRTDPFVARP